MKKEEFKIFNDEFLGRLFLPEGLLYENVKATIISPFHGRAVALRLGDYDWISVKGGGWNYGGPQVYISNKDEELIFGLYPLISAERELAVGRLIERFSDEFPKVLYYKNLCDFTLPDKYRDIQTAKFRNGEYVKPCLLYTRVKSPFRVADLTYLDENERKSIVKQCCDFWEITEKNFTVKFTEKLAERVALLHKNGFINDTLDYGNVTMLAEIIDYEWVTAPNIKLLDGSYGKEISEERKEKEILYGAEVCLQLKAILREEFNLFDVYRTFVNSYMKVNKHFVETNENVQKILRKEEIIL
ncbi:MAG: hypothetical protein SPL13_03545 [Clostridia bacterium]|nr:hypothetical protein [Clostridia bacterium]